ncbi:MAG TPA: glycosyltransferase family 2 protein [Dehalococcoidia bacterium]|nr:glycosyltransferase family 2 protein [Dehalococcoidia bacterium]
MTAAPADLVSIVIPAYNVGPYIGATIDSALAQTYRPVEVIVVDDGSTDETASVCASFGDRIFYLRQRNRGAAAARNTGLRHAHGEFVAFLDGDDLWDPRTVATQVDAVQRFPDSGLVAVDGVEFDDSGTVLSSTLMPPAGRALLARAGVSVWHGYCYADLLDGTPVSTSSQIMVPARVFQTVGDWNSRFPVSHDYDLYLRIAAHFPITLVAATLVRWRRRPTSLSGPPDLRFFNWRKDTAAILREQLRSGPRAFRGAVKRSLHRAALEIAKEAYYRGHRGHRLWAARYLLRLARTSRQFHLVTPFLAGLFAPAAIRRLAGRRVRALTGDLFPRTSQ